MSWALGAGDVLAHYRVVSPLGSGGMAQVYLAEDVRLGRRLALKVLSPRGARDHERLQRFQREARAVSALNHPNILTVYDVGHQQLVGETKQLYTRLRAEQQYTARQFLFAGTHVALARAELDRASGFLNEAKALLTKLNSDTDPAWRVYHSYAAKLALEQRRFPDAERSASAALRLSQLQAIDPDASLFVAEDLFIHAQALLGIGETTRARDEAKRAMTHLETVAGREHPLRERARALPF